MPCNRDGGNVESAKRKTIVWRDCLPKLLLKINQADSRTDQLTLIKTKSPRRYQTELNLQFKLNVMKRAADGALSSYLSDVEKVSRLFLFFLSIGSKFVKYLNRL